MEVLQQTTEIQKIANDIDKGIEAFEKRKAELTELASKADGLKIESIDDRKSINEVSTLRKELKSARVDIQKEGKSMRDPLTGISKFIIEKEKELVGIIELVEKDLKDQEDWVKSEKERIAEEIRLKEEQKINDRINSLSELGFKIDYSDLKAMDDNEFTELLNEAKERYEDEQAALRLEEERQAKIEERKQRLFELGMNYSSSTEFFTGYHAPGESVSMEVIETTDDDLFDEIVKSLKEVIDVEKHRIEEQKKRDEAERLELEKQRKQNEELQAKLKAQQDKIEAEKKALEDAKLKAEQDRRHQIELEKARKESAEKAKLQAIADAKRKEEEKAEKERKAKEKAERKAAMAPDKEKIEIYLESISSTVTPELKSDEGKSVMEAISHHILMALNKSVELLKELN